MFKKKRGIRLSYEEQGLIYFVCRNLKRMPNAVKVKVTYLCKLVAGEDWRPLYLLLTSKGRDLEQLASEYYISDKRLSRYRKDFYESFFEFMGNALELRTVWSSDKMSGN